MILNEIKNNEKSFVDIEQIYIYLSWSRVSSYLCVMIVCYDRIQ